MNWTKLIPIVGAIIRVIQAIRAKPEQPEGTDVAKQAQAGWRKRMDAR